MTRRKALQGAYNFRDTGGCPVADGVTRFGRLWRADLLGMLPKSDIEAILEAGIKTVIDLDRKSVV